MIEMDREAAEKNVHRLIESRKQERTLQRKLDALPDDERAEFLQREQEEQKNRIGKSIWNRSADITNGQKLRKERSRSS